jgi:hypothetical protein
MFYRPFIHYLTPIGLRGPFAVTVDSKMESHMRDRAAKCLQTSRTILRSVEDLVKKRRFNSAYWVGLIFVAC